jgi:hypothetical protein
MVPPTWVMVHPKATKMLYTYVIGDIELRIFNTI